MNRRHFLTFFASILAAPVAVARVVSAPKAQPLVLFGCTTPAQTQRAALWMRQCGHAGNPAWVYYDLLVQQGYGGQIDVDSVRRAAAYCEEPVG